MMKKSILGFKEVNSGDMFFLQVSASNRLEITKDCIFVDSLIDVLWVGKIP
jgi:hypothetical protein